MAEAARVSLIDAMDKADVACNKVQQLVAARADVWQAAKLCRDEVMHRLLNLNSYVVEIQNLQVNQLNEIQRDFRNATRQLRGLKKCQSEK